MSSTNLPINFDLVYQLIADSGLLAQPIDRQSAIDMAKFIAASARAPDGSIILTTIDATKKTKARREAILLSMSRVARALGHTFTDEAAQLALMMVSYVFDTSGEKWTMYWNTYHNGQPSQTPIAWRLEADNAIRARYGSASRVPALIGLPLFVDPGIATLLWLTLIYPGPNQRIPPILGQIVHDYLYTPTISPPLRESYQHLLPMTPFFRWWNSLPRDTSLYADDIMARLRDTRPDLLAEHGQEIDNWLVEQMRSHKHTRPDHELMVQAWGLGKSWRLASR